VEQEQGETPIHPQAQGEAYPRRWWVLGVLCLSLVLVVAGNSAVNVALPTLVRELGATQTQLQWIVDSYAIVFAGLLLPAGALGDRFGRKRALQLGLLVFGAAAIAASFAVNPGQVIAARAVLGGAAALIMPATLSILTTVFPAEERGRAIAIWAGFAGAGGAIGPVMSGLLLEEFSWPAVFLINLPIIVLALGLGLWLVPKSRDVKQRPLDPVGALLSVIGLGGLLYGIIEGPNIGWLDPLTIAGFVIGLVFLAAFAAWEGRIAEPMIDLSWFKIPAFATGAATLALAFFAYLGVIFLITQYFQFVLDYSPLRAGFAQLPLPLALVLVSPNSAPLAERFGARRVLVAGLAVLSGGLAYLALLTGLDTPYLVVVPGLLMLGTGIALSTAPSTALIMSSLPPGKAGVGSAVNDVTREFGVATGVAILGSVLASIYRSSLESAGLPARVLSEAQVSIGAALDLARRENSAEVEGLAEIARQAFTDGFHGALAGGAMVALLAAILIYRFAPPNTSLEDNA
jgi:EmrB/QacA subfamily drug resistance transporter